jgi:hypothetical protein
VCQHWQGTHFKQLFFYYQTLLLGQAFRMLMFSSHPAAMLGQNFQTVWWKQKIQSFFDRVFSEWAINSRKNDPWWDLHLVANYLPRKLAFKKCLHADFILVSQLTIIFHSTQLHLRRLALRSVDCSAFRILQSWHPMKYSYMRDMSQRLIEEAQRIFLKKQVQVSFRLGHV